MPTWPVPDDARAAQIERDLALEHLRLAVELGPTDARAKKLLKDHRR